MSVDIIKEYLTQIGFQVDNKSFDDVKSKLTQLEQTMGKLSTSIVGRMTLATAAVTGFGVAVTGVLGKFMADMARADQQTEMFARRMLTTERNARSLKTVMDTMGLSSLEDLKDINLNPELRRQFMALRAQAFALEPGADVQEGLKEIREVGYEFQRMKVIASYALLDLAGKLSKHLFGPMTSLRQGMKKFNDMFAKNIDRWMDKLAKALTLIAKMSVAAFKFLELLWKLPNAIKAAAAAVIAFGVAIKMSPLGAWITALETLALLLEDFMVYKAGGVSGLPEVWGSLDSIITPIIGLLQNIDNTLTAIASTLGVKGVRAYEILKGALGGALGGGAVGAAAGSVVPGVGTGAGAVGGAAVGAVKGAWDAANKPVNQQAYKAKVQAFKTNVADPVMQRIAAAQAALESGNGKSLLARKYNNYFGIKGVGPAGSVVLPTQEFYGGRMHTVNGKFRAYHNVAESYQDHLDFLRKNMRYKKVWEAKTFEEKAWALQRAGYATDPNYAKKLIQIDKRNGGMPQGVNISINVDARGNNNGEEIAAVIGQKLRNTLNTTMQQGAYA